MSQSFDTTGSEKVKVTSSALPSGAATSAKQDTEIASLASIDGKITAVDTDSVTVVASALPSGAATGAKQDIGNASLASIDGKTPALGQALAAASVPVVLTAAQLSTLTPPAAITGYLTESDFDTKVGALTEAAPASDTDSSGLNGRLQRIAQRLTSLIALLPAALTGSGNFKVAVQEALPAGTNAIGKLAANSGVDIGDVDVLTVPADPFGANADAASATGSISAKLRFIAATGIPITGTVTVGSHAVTNAGTFAVQPGAATSGGCDIFRSLDLDETEEDVKTSAGQIYGLLITNTATTTRWIKFYNATAANVTVGSTTPVITFGIPGNSTDDIGAAFFGANGIGFSTAISVAATTGVADADTGAPAANDVIINVFYK